MKKNKPRLFITMLFALCCVMAFSVTAMASDEGCYASNENGTETPPDAIDQISISTASVSVSSDTSSKALTPDGNLSLVDDILQDESCYVQDEQTVKNKQFITVQSKKGVRYDQALKVIKLKQMAKTFMFLEEHGYADINELANAATEAESRYLDLKNKIKTAETRMVEIQSLRTHILNYVKTNDVWKEYKNSHYSKAFLAEHEGDIILHRASKKAFDDLVLKKLPTVKSLNEEFAKLLAEKKAAYADYHKTQNEMRELMIHKANAEYILGIDEQKAQRREYQYE